MEALEIPRDPTDSGRVIRPAAGGSLALDDRHFRLEDIDALTSALIEKSEGRLRQLTHTTKEIESRLRKQIGRSRENIRRARELAEEEISNKLEEASRNAAQVCRQKYQEAWEEGRREGEEKGTEVGYEKGYQEGLENGWQQGRQEGREAAEREMTEANEARWREETDDSIQSIQQLANELGGEWRRSLDGARAGLLDVAIAVAEEILEREVKQVPETIVSTLERIWRRLGDEKRLVIRVHPSDRALLERHLPNLVEQHFSDTAVQINEDPTILRGGCDVRGQHTLIEGSFKTQLEIARDRLEEAGGVR